MSMPRIRAKPLVCPWCDARLSRVVDGRETPRSHRTMQSWSGEGFWRLRECQVCGKRFTTEERVTGIFPVPQKKSHNIL